MKRTGLAVLTLLMATLAPVVHAAGYIEVWNPPEARATAPHRGGAARKLTVPRPAVPRTMKVHARHAPALAPKLMAKQSNIQRDPPASEPDMSQIPRQITPEGNVLRVDARGMPAEVIR
ncbi:hypothetical protein BCY88_13360 [Paraburkholderia fungorum]|uniref:Uncharacterized protein n=1 Tax=Paraburkholderia fungorum TaxID=134537 RepID=A0A3R7GM99_9BURK|nr:hypothetical protein BCY88_13360 [Paraburkholderia fungorum]